MNTSVRSADRTLAIFEVFEAAQTQLQLGELAERCDMPLSTCHALVQTLLKRGYLYTVGRRKALYPNARLLKMAENIASNDPFISRISEVLDQLSTECGETITVGKREGDSVLYLYAAEGPRTIRYAARAGEYRQLHSTSLGKAILSDLEPKALNEWLKGHSLKKVTSNTITSKAALLNDLEKGRLQGYFVSSGEQSEDSTSVAVLLEHYAGTLALSLTGPTYRMAPLVDTFGKRLLQAKQKIEQLTNY